MFQQGILNGLSILESSKDTKVGKYWWIYCDILFGKTGTVEGKTFRVPEVDKSHKILRGLLHGS